MNSFEINLDRAISLCDGDFKYITDFFRIYSFATENVSGYIDYFDLKDKSLLTVGSSGDQILNAFYNGARDITLFDINPYAKYYVYLKISSILSLSYEEFKSFFFQYVTSPFKKNDAMFSKDLFDRKIKPTLRLFDYESFLFFDELFSLYDGSVVRSRLFDDDENRHDVIIGFNNYLKDEESYNKLKGIIKKIYFKYISGDIFKDDISVKYDNIFLSNLCSLVGVDELKVLISKLDSNNLNPSGSMLLGYLWDTDFSSNEYYDNWKEIYKMPIVREKLGTFITEAYSVRGAKNILFDDKMRKDLVLLYRKK